MTTELALPTETTAQLAQLDAVDNELAVLRGEASMANGHRLIKAIAQRVTAIHAMLVAINFESDVDEVLARIDELEESCQLFLLDLELLRYARSSWEDEGEELPPLDNDIPAPPMPEKPPPDASDKEQIAYEHAKKVRRRTIKRERWENNARAENAQEVVRAQKREEARRRVREEGKRAAAAIAEVAREERAKRAPTIIADAGTIAQAAELTDLRKWCESFVSFHDELLALGAKATQKEVLHLQLQVKELNKALDRLTKELF